MKTALFISIAAINLSLTVLPQEMWAQITEEEAYPVDSILATEWLAEPVIHNINVHDTPGGPVETWDAGSGLYTNIPGYSVAWSYKNKVDDSTASAINGMQGQSYKTFNLQQMADTSVYRDSVEAWLYEIGIPVWLTENYFGESQITIYPNPGRDIFTIKIDNLKTGEKYKLIIKIISGKVLKKTSGITDRQDATVNFDLTGYPAGVYLICFEKENGGPEIRKIIKR